MNIFYIDYYVYSGKSFARFFFVGQTLIRQTLLLLVDDGLLPPFLAGTPGHRHRHEDGDGDDRYHHRKHVEASLRDGGPVVCRSGRCTGVADPRDGGGVGQQRALTVKICLRINNLVINNINNKYN
jgi:hypothetical protein